LQASVVVWKVFNPREVYVGALLDKWALSGAGFSPITKIFPLQFYITQCSSLSSIIQGWWDPLAIEIPRDTVSSHCKNNKIYSEQYPLGIACHGVHKD
jgi:hypothetical protein